MIMYIYVINTNRYYLQYKGSCKGDNMCSGVITSFFLKDLHFYTAI